MHSPPFAENRSRCLVDVLGKGFFKPTVGQGLSRDRLCTVHLRQVQPWQQAYVVPYAYTTGYCAPAGASVVCRRDRAAAAPSWLRLSEYSVVLVGPTSRQPTCCQPLPASSAYSGYAVWLSEAGNVVCQSSFQTTATRSGRDMITIHASIHSRTSVLSTCQAYQVCRPHCRPCTLGVLCQWWPGMPTAQ